MKRLIALISTKGKSPEQITKELFSNLSKYKRAKALAEKSSKDKPEQDEIEILIPTRPKPNNQSADK